MCTEAVSAAVGSDNFDVTGVVVEDRAELGGATAIAGRAFQPGDRVFRERALVVATGITNLARVRAYCGLNDEGQRRLRENFWGEAPAVRCQATAACRPETIGTGDSAADVLVALREEGFGDLALDEVEAVIRVWNLNAYDCALAPIACKVGHSCAPNIFVNVDLEVGSIEATACRAIAEGESLGSWYFQDTGLWWMGSDVRRTIFETDRGFLCGCIRCKAPDVCRALPCAACRKGYAIPDATLSASTATWRCTSCDRSGPGDMVRLKAEADIVPRVLLELRPPKNTARATPEELAALGADARERLGDRHWAAVAATLVLHFRGRPSGGALDPFTVACGVRFLGWLIDRSLPTPPSSIVRTPIALSMDCATWLSLDAPASSPDRRCIASRVLVQFLLPVFDISGAAVAKVANTGTRVEALRAWLSSLQGTCGCCGKVVAGTSAASRESDASAPTALACGRCKQVRYCSKECQQKDWKQRHKEGCLPLSESLAGDAAWQLLMSSRGSV